MARCSWPQCPDCENTCNNTGTEAFGHPIPTTTSIKMAEENNASSSPIPQPEEPPLFSCTFTIDEAMKQGIFLKTKPIVSMSGNNAGIPEKNEKIELQKPVQTYNMKILSVLKEMNFDENHDLVSKTLQAKVHVEKVNEQNPDETDKENLENLIKE